MRKLAKNHRTQDQFQSSNRYCLSQAGEKDANSAVNKSIGGESARRGSDRPQPKKHFKDENELPSLNMITRSQGNHKK